MNKNVEDFFIKLTNYRRSLKSMMPFEDVEEKAKRGDYIKGER